MKESAAARAGRINEEPVLIHWESGTENNKAN
jgi:hypothetical protein